MWLLFRTITGEVILTDATLQEVILTDATFQEVILTDATLQETVRRRYAKTVAGNH